MFDMDTTTTTTTMYGPLPTTTTTDGLLPTDSGDSVVTLDQVPRWIDAEFRLSYEIQDLGFPTSYPPDPLVSSSGAGSGIYLCCMCTIGFLQALISNSSKYGEFVYNSFNLYASEEAPVVMLLCFRSLLGFVL